MRTFLLMIVLALSCESDMFGQAVRFDSVSYTTSASCASGKQCNVLALPGTRVSVCQGSAASLAACQGTPATTYTSAAASVACGSGAQLTPATGGACLSTADNQGNFGFWVLPGSYSYYMVVPATAGGGTYGPYPINLGASAGCPSGVTCDANYSTIALGCAAAGSGTLYITQPWNGLTTQTLACAKQFLGNGKLQPAFGQVVTLSGGLDGSLSQHFDYSAGGSFAATPSFKVAVLYPQWLGAKGDGKVVTDGAMASTSTLNSATASFTIGNVGNTVAVSGCGTSGSGLTTTISAYVSATRVTLAAPCQTTVTGATVIFGTDEYTALRNTSTLTSALLPGKVLFPTGNYFIGTYKTAIDSCTSVAQDIEWNRINGVDIDLNGSAVIPNTAFYQNADCSTPNKSRNNMVAPFYVTESINWHVHGGTINAYTQTMTRKAAGADSECLTCYAVAAGKHANNAFSQTGYSIYDLTITQPQTDGVVVGSNSLSVDSNVLVQNVTCTQAGRLCFQHANANYVHYSGVHGSNTGTGSYGSFQPKGGIDFEPNLASGYGIVIDGSSSFTDNVGYDTTVSDPTLFHDLTVGKTTYTWNNCTKEQGVNFNAASSVVTGNFFIIGCSASVNNIQLLSGGPSAGHISQLFEGNVIDSSGLTTGSGAPMITTGYGDASGTFNPVDVVNNYFKIKALAGGLGWFLRNARNVERNYFFAVATGAETAGANTTGTFEGTIAARNNYFTTDLAVAGKYFANIYVTPMVIIENDQYPNYTFMRATGSLTSGTTLVNQPVPNNLFSNSSFASSCAGWTFDTNATCGAGVATFTAVASNGVYQGVNIATALAPCQLTYTITGYVSGTFTAFGPGGIAGTGRTANGTYYENLTPASSGAVNFGVRGGGPATGNVSNLRMYCQN